MKVITTETIGSETDFLAPRYADSYVVNKGLIFTQTHNSSVAGRIVPFTVEQKGIYVLKAKGKRANLSRKIAID